MLPWVACFYGSLWLKEYEIYGQHEAEEGGQMVPVQGLSLEHHGGDDREDDERNDFLNHFKLHQVERAAVAFEAKPVGRYLATVFCESYHPREKDDADKRPMGRYARLLQLQMAVPGQRHENVAADEQQDGVDCIHVYVFFRAQSYENKVVACAVRAEKRRLRRIVAQFVIRLLVIKLLLNGKITIFAMG